MSKIPSIIPIPELMVLSINNENPAYTSNTAFRNNVLPLNGGPTRLRCTGSCAYIAFMNIFLIVSSPIILANSFDVLLSD